MSDQRDRMIRIPINENAEFLDEDIAKLQLPPDLVRQLSENGYRRIRELVNSFDSAEQMMEKIYDISRENASIVTAMVFAYYCGNQSREELTRLLERIQQMNGTPPEPPEPKRRRKRGRRKKFRLDL